ncbi:MAG: hypothetical protein M1816_005132 [Peltula sp. TS41687]|nr:MAG: hypothetical protein M1816_005132 [Peltula sp. TS41687]
MRRSLTSSPPYTPTKTTPSRHHPAGLDLLQTSPTSSMHRGRRRSSLTATPRTPTNQHLRSSQYQALTDSARMAEGGGGLAAGGNGVGFGLGSLADELADAWDEEGEGEGEGEGDETVEDEDEDDENDERSWRENQRQQNDGCHDSSSYARNGEMNLSDTSPRKELTKKDSTTTGSKLERKTSKRQRLKLGEEDRDEDDDLNEISSALEARLAEISTLAQRGLMTINDRAEDDDIFDRILTHLQDLGSQADIESSTTKLINAHITLTHQLALQTRHLQRLTYPLLSPHCSSSSSSSASFPSDLLPSTLLDPLLASLPLPLAQRDLSEGGLSASGPQPQTPTLAPLSRLTSDVIETLTHLSDSLYMARQTTLLASRRLRSARDMAAEMMREHAAVEKAARWIEEGRWDERLKGRQCGRLCEEVVMGFEEVCRGWRERIAVGELGGVVGAGEVEVVVIAS